MRFWPSNPNNSWMCMLGEMSAGMLLVRSLHWGESHLMFIISSMLPLLCNWFLDEQNSVWATLEELVLLPSTVRSYTKVMLTTARIVSWLMDSPSSLCCLLPSFQKIKSAARCWKSHENSDFLRSCRHFGVKSHGHNLDFCSREVKHREYQEMCADW